MRGEGERASSLGALYLTNVQQFYERPDAGQDQPEELTAVLGPKLPGKPRKSRISGSASPIAAGGRLSC
jgi:hypothetical protein